MEIFTWKRSEQGWSFRAINSFRRHYPDLVFVSYTTLIILLATFIMYRDMINTMAGPSLVESQWGFGQVLALATWLPTFLDLMVVGTGTSKCPLLSPGGHKSC